MVRRRRGGGARCSRRAPPPDLQAAPAPPLAQGTERPRRQQVYPAVLAPFAVCGRSLTLAGSRVPMNCARCTKLPARGLARSEHRPTRTRRASRARLSGWFLRSDCLDDALCRERTASEPDGPGSGGAEHRPPGGHGSSPRSVSPTRCQACPPAGPADPSASGLGGSSDSCSVPCGTLPYDCSGIPAEPRSPGRSPWCSADWLPGCCRSVVLDPAGSSLLDAAPDGCIPGFVGPSSPRFAMACQPSFRRIVGVAEPPPPASGRASAVPGCPRAGRFLLLDPGGLSGNGSR